MNCCLVLVLLASFAPNALAQASHLRRDGSWWTTQTEAFKLAYIAGFYDGMPLGYHFSYWKLKTDSDSSCIQQIIESFATYEDKYIGNTSNTQVVEGLNSFYSDPRNRQIKLTHAVWLVVNGIAGMPQRDLDKMIESWRKNAPD